MMVSFPSICSWRFLPGLVLPYFTGHGHAAIIDRQLNDLDTNTA